MIDKENEIYTRVKYAVSSLCANCGSTEPNVETSMPYTYISQLSNIGVDYSLSGAENAVNPYIELKIYSNDTNAKTICKAILSLADTSLVNMGFQRFYGPTQLLDSNDRNIKFYVVRYRRILCAGDSLT